MTALQKEALEKNRKYIRRGISIRQVGIGDGVQFTSLPENFYFATGERLIDISKPWYFDNNPYVIRDIEPRDVIELWNYPKKYDWPKIRTTDIYLSNAEIHLSIFGLSDPVLTRPRLYRFEEAVGYEDRKTILFHPQGRSQGRLPDHVINHVIKKYQGCDLIQIGLPTDPDIGLPRAKTETLWDLSQLISRCKLFIGVDSGPAWIAACYPDVQIKKIRIKFQHGYREPKDWVPLERENPHSYWDDLTLSQIYNCERWSIGFTRSYLEI